MNRRFLTLLGAALLASTVAAPAAFGAQWRFETLDGNAATGGRTIDDVGEHQAAIVYLGAPHVFYADDDVGDLRHAWFAPGVGWYYETLDGNAATGGRTTGDVGSARVTTTVYLGGLHLFYGEITNGFLRHAWFVPGVGWYYETLDGNAATGGRTTGNVGEHASSILYSNAPHVFYGDATGRDLRHAWYSGSSWRYETLDGDGLADHTAAFVDTDSAALLYQGAPHLFYEQSTSSYLRHAFYVPGTGWLYETLDGHAATGGRTTDDVGQNPAALLYQGQPHVWYRDDFAGRLRHAFYTGTTWAYETLDGAGGDVGTWNAVTLYQGQPHVWYHRENAGGALRHAWYTGSTWQYETLDGTGAPGGANRVGDDTGTHNTVLLWNGTLHVWSHRPGGGAFDLRHAWYQ